MKTLLEKSHEQDVYWQDYFNDMVFKKVDGVKYTKMRHGREFKSPDSKTAFDALLDSKSEISKEEYDNPKWKPDSYFR